MKIVHNINKWSFIITLLLYITVIGGLLAQIALGCIQVTLGIILLTYWQKLNNKSKIHILIYWGLVLIYGLTWFLFQPSSNDFLLFLYYVFIPMGIAAYFVYITYRTKKASNEFQLTYI